jgi:hypothetical protein
VTKCLRKQLREGRFILALVPEVQFMVIWPCALGQNTMAGEQMKRGRAHLMANRKQKTGRYKTRWCPQ